MASERLHRWIRALLAHYPVLRGAAWLNRRLDRLFAAPQAQWLLAPARAGWPTMVLDVTHNLQRKFFYYPKVYGHFYGDTPLRRFLERRLVPGATYLDIGANVGFFALRAAALVGATGRVYAFEPDPRLHAALARSVAANGFTQLRTFPIALSDREGELPFYRSRDGTSSSLVFDATQQDRTIEATLPARVTTLDRMVERGELELARLDVVKIDVEGEEVRTVAGMRRTLTATNPAIWCEVRGPKGSTRAPGTHAGVFAQLAELGYRPYLCDGDDRRPITAAEVIARTDVLFERA